MPREPWKSSAVVPKPIDIRTIQTESEPDGQQLEFQFSGAD